jgi:hypothetical protein
MNIPFSPPFIDQTVIDEVVNTLQSSWKLKSLTSRLPMRQYALTPGRREP